MERLKPSKLKDSSTFNARTTQYHSVDPSEIKSIFTTRFENNLEITINQLQSLKRQQQDNTETREGIWTIRGHEAINKRIGHLIKEAEDNIVFGVNTVDLLTDQLVNSLQERAQTDISILVISRDTTVRNRFTSLNNIHAVQPPDSLTDNDQTERILMVDNESILHSIIGNASPAHAGQETAFWSQNSGFARMVIGLMNETLAGVTTD